MVAADILKIAFLAINHWPIVRFQLNFAWGSRTAGRQGLRDKKCKFLESNMADGRHFESRKIAISQWKIVRFCWNLVHYIRYWTRLRSRDQKLKFLKFKMAAAAILKSLFGHKSSNDWTISAKFCMRKQNGMLTNATGQKMHIFTFQDGGRPPFWKSLNCHISVKNRPILMKFGTLHQILNPIIVTRSKLQFLKFKMATAAILKIGFLAILINRLSDFSEILYEKAERHADMGYGTKKCKCIKFKMADGRHFENR